jgi:hypothetical protein
MKEPLESSLEQRMHELLRQLPDRPAPATLAPRVMAAIAARKTPQVWWRRPFWGWPWTLQVVVLFGVLAGLTGVIYWGGAWSPQLSVSPVFARISDLGTDLASLGRALLSLADAAALVLSTLLRPWLMVALGLIGVMYLCCLGVGTLFYRVAYRRF